MIGYMNCGISGLTTALTIYGFGLRGNSAEKSTRKHRFWTKKHQKVNKSSQKTTPRGFGTSMPQVQVLLPAPAASCRPQASGGDSKDPNPITRRWGSDFFMFSETNICLSIYKVLLPFLDKIKYHLTKKIISIFIDCFVLLTMFAVGKRKSDLIHVTSKMFRRCEQKLSLLISARHIIIGYDKMHRWVFFCSSNVVDRRTIVYYNTFWG